MYLANANMLILLSLRICTSHHQQPKKIERVLVQQKALEFERVLKQVHLNIPNRVSLIVYKNAANIIWEWIRVLHKPAADDT
jgi:hypothetical protein